VGNSPPHPLSLARAFSHPLSHPPALSLTHTLPPSLSLTHTHTHTAHQQLLLNATASIPTLLGVEVEEGSEVDDVVGALLEELRAVFAQDLEEGVVVFCDRGRHQVACFLLVRLGFSLRTTTSQKCKAVAERARI